MTMKPSAPRAGSRKSGRDRRSPHSQTGSVSWLKSFLGRPLALERRDGQLHITLVDRRRSPEEVEAEAVNRLCAELRARLLAHESDHATVVMRHLVAVHDRLSKRGWSGVESLTSKLLGKALDQAQMLSTHEPSRGMVELIERLRVLRAAAQVREERQPRAAARASTDSHFGADELEVTETTQEDFESTARSWELAAAQAALTPEVPK